MTPVQNGAGFNWEDTGRGGVGQFGLLCEITLSWYGNPWGRLCVGVSVQNTIRHPKILRDLLLPWVEMLWSEHGAWLLGVGGLIILAPSTIWG